MMKINEELLNKYLQEEMIFEFKDEKEFMDYVIYDCPDIPSEYTKDMDSIKEYFDEFLFEYKGKYYSVGYSEALDVYETDEILFKCMDQQYMITEMELNRYMLFKEVNLNHGALVEQYAFVTIIEGEYTIDELIKMAREYIQSSSTL